MCEQGEGEGWGSGQRLWRREREIEESEGEDEVRFWSGLGLEKLVGRLGLKGWRS